MSSIWSIARRPHSNRSTATLPSDDCRTAYQRDYDRLLFSAPVRRLADKTQVWPMDKNDGVRTRLTHSHEVANLARSIGARIADRKSDAFGDKVFHLDVAPLLQAIGICHDLGNPPFGHQGEAAIGRWFTERQEWIFDKFSGAADASRIPHVPPELRAEFTKFDGNPQSIRLITQLQTHIDDMGLDLTAGTIIAALKYPVDASNMESGKSANKIRKKFGYFESERSIIEWARNETSISEGQRHPLTWIMEACDDIAYSVLDVDDAMKKGIISPNDVLAIIKQNNEIDEKLISRIEHLFNRADLSEKDRKSVNDIKISYLRAVLIEKLIENASFKYIENITSINDLSHDIPLMEGDILCEKLKDIAKEYAFKHTDLLKAEAIGARAITDLMTWFWDAIQTRKDENDLDSRRTSPHAAYIFAHISPNYIATASRVNQTQGKADTTRYRELRLLTDMVSGMTDTFAMDLWNQLRAYS